MKFIAFLLFGASIAHATLVLPPSAKAPNITPAALATATAMAFHYGPGVWVAPGLTGLTSKVTDSLLTLSSKCVLDEKLATADSLLAPYKSTLVGLYTPTSCSPLDSQTVLLGINGAGGTAVNWTSAYSPDAYAWIQNLEYEFNLLQKKGMVVNGQSSGGMFLNEIGSYQKLGYLPSRPVGSTSHLYDETAREIYWRHNLQTASYRAIGLDPMWTGQIPTLNPAVPEGVADYYVNIFSKFFYNEGLKHHTSSGPDFLGLLYKVFAANLSYQAGLIQYRYAPIDPSCRYPVVNGLCPIAASDLKAIYYEWNNGSLQNPAIVNFGTAGDFVTIYDIIKFFAETANSDPQTIALAIANGDTSSFASAVTSGLAKIGASAPNSLQSTITVAKAIFDAADTIWYSQDSVAKESAIFMPRVSSALIVAAALVGKRVDPIFWGTLAEAEQYQMKANPSGYAAWADKLLTPSNTQFQSQFGTSLFDYASTRPPDGLYAPKWAPSSLISLLKSAIDSSTQTFALARGPNGLDSISGERFELASEFDNRKFSSPLSPMQFPNAFLEVAASGRAVIDGRLLMTTDGKVKAYDIDDTLSTVEFPFELGVLRSYQKLAAQALGVSLSQVAGQVLAMSAQTRSLIGAPIPAWALNGESDYQVSVGESKPLNPNASDSRYFQPSLEYWLVIADKLNSNGLDSLNNYDPPEIQSVTYSNIPIMTDPNTHVTYGLMNIANPISNADIQTYQHKPYNPPADSAHPTSNALPLDSDQLAYPVPQFINDVLELQNQVLTHPFVSDANPFL